MNRVRADLALEMEQALRVAADKADEAAASLRDALTKAHNELNEAKVKQAAELHACMHACMHATAVELLSALVKEACLCIPLGRQFAGRRLVCLTEHFQGQLAYSPSLPPLLPIVPTPNFPPAHSFSAFTTHPFAERHHKLPHG